MAQCAQSIEALLGVNNQKLLDQIVKLLEFFRVRAFDRQLYFGFLDVPN